MKTDEAIMVAEAVANSVKAALISQKPSEERPEAQKLLSTCGGAASVRHSSKLVWR